MENMAQEQPNRESGSPQHQKPIKHGNVFNVLGQVADKPILSGDPTVIDSAEKMVTGHSPLSSPASLVDPKTHRTTEGIRVTKSDDGGNRVVTESGDDVVGYLSHTCFLD